MSDLYKCQKMISKIYFPRWISDWHIFRDPRIVRSGNRPVRIGLRFLKILSVRFKISRFFGPGSSQSDWFWSIDLGLEFQPWRSFQGENFDLTFSIVKIFFAVDFFSAIFMSGTMSAQLWFECITLVYVQVYTCIDYK